MFPVKRSRSSGRGLSLAVGLFLMVAIPLTVIATRQSTSVGSATGNPNPDCVGVIVVSSQEKSDLLKKLAGQYNATRPTEQGKCVDVRVNSRASGAAEQALAAGWNAAGDGPKPVVWTPAATSWLGILSQETARQDRGSPAPLTAESLMQSPLVLAMPRPMAEALGWPDTPIGWADFLRLAEDPRGWGAHGHPAWGRFQLGKTSPAQSTSGLHALLAAYYAATGVSADLSPHDVENPKVRTFVAGVESSVIHYSSTVSTFFDGLRVADAQGAGMSYVSAIATEEQQVLAYDARRPVTPLVAVYPSDGTMVADHPFAILNAPWVTPDQRAAAAGFLGWLLKPAQQDRFLGAGFRDHAGHAAGNLTSSSGIVPAGPALILKPPSPAVLDLVRKSWDSIRKRARILIVLDVSGSMEGEKIANVRKAALAAVKSFAPDDEVGLWSFSTAVYPLDPIAPVGSGGVQVAKDIGSLQADGATALFEATRDAVRAVQQDWDPGRINAVLLMTDGQDSWAHGGDLDALVHDLAGQPAATRVPVFTIGYGSDADLPTLAKISSASHGRTYNAPDPSRVGAVFTDVISNF